MTTKYNFDVRKTRLENGLVIVSERMPYLRSVSFGIFLKSGSRQETAAQHGLTHFIEHALFKGTRNRSVAQVAAEGDSLGGHLDAFTGREMVGYCNNVLDEHLPRAFDLLADLVTAPAFDAAELEKERNVIIEEIKMVEDTPDDIIFDLFCENFYPAHPLGRTILGTAKTLLGFKNGVVESYYDQIYRPDNFVLAAAGNFEHDEILAYAQKYFGRLKPRQLPLETTTPEPAAPITLRHKADLEQAHVVIGVPCASLVSDDFYTANLLSVILGGGMSSRLFQSIREELGLAYSVLSSINPFKDCGYLTIYLGASTEQLEPALKAAMAELQRIKQEPIPEAELQLNKDQLKAAVRLNLESASARMSALAANEMNFGRYISPDEVLADIEAVTADGLHRMANEIFQTEKLSVTALGNLKGFKLKRSQLVC
ncbi:MAG TPA: pitrilysin family protein [Blastocatellia bacterium]|nr:pitrilysin family protein [Blastocatellia bacterium]